MKRAWVHFYFQIIIFAILTALSFFSNASSSSGDCKDNSNLSDIRILAKKLHREETHLIDATFMYEAKKSDQGEISVKGVSVYAGVPNPADQIKVYQMLNATSGTPSGPFAAATSFQGAMNLLSSQKNILSTDQKLLYLSMLGSMLGSGYDYSLTNSNMESVFQNLRNGGRQGGICGDIHTYLSKAAEALGFTDAGINTLNWQQNGEIGGHWVMHFRDPKTGQYYIGNYSGIYATGATTLTEASDVSTRILAPLTGASAVEGRPGIYHMYVPKTARWVENQIENAGAIHADEPIIRAQFGTTQNTVRFQTTGHESVKGFYVHSERTESDGKYILDAAGISAATQETKTKAFNGAIDEIGYEAKVMLGENQVSIPQVIPSYVAGKNWSQSSLFGIADVKGTARINNTTGKLEISGKTIDLAPKTKYGVSRSTSVQVKIGADYRQPGSPVGVETERLIELAPKSWTKTGDLALQTTYDKVRVVVDNRDDENKKVFLVYKGDVYAMEGFERTAAVGIKQSLKAVIPAGTGEFSVAVDASKIVSNPSNDPFYESKPSVSAKASWGKKVDSKTTVGVGASVTQNQPFFLFEEPGSTSPSMTSNSGRVTQGFIYIRTEM